MKNILTLSIWHLATALLWGTLLNAAPVDLTFANYAGGTQPDDATGMRYTDVANVGTSGLDVNAVIRNLTSYDGNNPENGTAGIDDAQLNMRRNSSTRFTLSFYDATSGNGYADLLDATGLEFKLVIYDLDGDDSNVQGSDQITMHTQATATYRAPSASDLIVDPNNDGSATWVGDGNYLGGNDNVPNPSSGATSLSDDQQRVSVQFDLTGQNVVDFTYTINNGQTDNATTAFNYRNLFIDGKDFDITGDTLIVAVPEMNSLALAGILIVAFVLYSKRIR